jgi:transcriptional regulator with XRE-family HTH domain
VNNKQFCIYIGTCCKKYRQKLGYTQQEVAFEIGTTRENVAKFEGGQNRNYSILLWYVNYDMNINKVVKQYGNESKRDTSII